MRQETKDKLDGLENSDRSNFRRGLTAVAVLTLVAGIGFASSSRIISERILPGEVRWAIWNVDHETGQRYPSMQVMLDDGRLVHAGTLQPQLPQVGMRVVVREKTGLWGNRWYAWEGRFVSEREP